MGEHPVEAGMRINFWVQKRAGYVAHMSEKCVPRRAAPNVLFRGKRLGSMDEGKRVLPVD